jgi:hypothetical protein
VSGPTLSPQERDPTRIAFAVRQLAEGRSNAVGSFTLTPTAASTTVPAANCGVGSSVIAFPRTASAAAELGNGTMHIATVSNGAFTVAHANNAQADRTFMYVALG